MGKVSVAAVVVMVASVAVVAGVAVVGDSNSLVNPLPPAQGCRRFAEFFLEGPGKVIRVSKTYVVGDLGSKDFRKISITGL